jgi:hypothetical protein
MTDQTETTTEQSVEQSENNDSESIVKEYSVLTQEIDTLLKTLLDSQRSLKNIKKDLDKSHLRELKNVRKKKKSDNGVKSNKEPSGFNKPALVPDEFCKQPWGCEPGQLIPRTQLTKMVYDYIKDNGLQDPADKRIIHPDKNVKTLFHLESGQDLEFKTFQTFMAKLYKKGKEEEVVVEKVVDDTDVKKPVKKSASRKKAAVKV